WTELQSRPYTPAPRQEHAAVWDDPDQSLLVFGGYRSASEFLGDLWSYRPAFGSWQTLGGAPPSARSGTAAAWDAARRRLLIFGGYGPTGYSADLWSYHPDTNTWMELAPGEAPPAREEATAVWDTANGELLVYGGQRDGRLLDDLWAYEPESDSWAELDREGDWPAARARQTAVWDADAERMLVFGGYGGLPGGYLDDVWSYEPGSNSWSPVETDGPVPSGRAGHIAVWDAASGRMLVWGGFAGGVDYLGDLWELRPDDGAWELLEPAGGPPARGGAAGVWDPTRRRLLVFGGGGSVASSELWSYED